jgi:vesicle transport through interaction with t-SNAREs protein 1
MDMEARSQPAERARQLAPKVKEYRADLAALRDQHQQQEGASSSSSAAAAAADAARAELGLMAGGGEDYTSSAAGQRDRMLAATERLQKTSDRLQQGKQQLAETEVRGEE